MPPAASHKERARPDVLAVGDVFGVGVADNLEDMVAAHGAGDDGRGGPPGGAFSGGGG